MTRVLAHAHSRWSYDGTLTLDEWRELARQHGVGQVLLTEHEEKASWTPERYAEYVEACSRASAPDVTLVPGIEFNQEGYHVLCYGLRRWPARPGPAEALAAAVHAQGCLLCLAHPGRYRWRYPDHLLKVADAIEVWNSNWVCDGRLGPHPRSLDLADGKALLAGQDVHKRKHVSPVFIETMTTDAVADLVRGQYRIRHGHHSWTVSQLRQPRMAGTLQRGRTCAIRTALQCYRSTRRAIRTAAYASGVYPRRTGRTSHARQS